MPHGSQSIQRASTFPLSVRAQLVIGSMAVLLLLLCVFGVAVRYIASTTLMIGVDNDLHHQLLAVTSPHGPPGGFPGRGGPPPFGNNRGGPPAEPPQNGGPGNGRGGPDDGAGPGSPGGAGEDEGEGAPEPPPPGSDERQSGGLGQTNGAQGTGRRESRTVSAQSPPAYSNPYAPRRFDSTGRPVGPREMRASPVDPESLRLALAGRTVYSTIVRSGQRVRVLSEPDRLRGGERARGAAQASYPLGGVDRALRSVDAALLMLIPLALLCAGLGGWWITGRALGRVGKITQAAAAIGARNLSERLPAAGRDEFSRLAQTFNGLLDRVDFAFQEQRRFTADASHELKTPLTVIQGTTSLALSMGENATLDHGAIQEIDGAAASMAHLVQDLLYLARADAGTAGAGTAGGRRVELLLADPAARAVSLVAPRSRARVTLRQTGAPAVVAASEGELTRLFVNLLENAARYTPEGGEIVVAVAQDENTHTAIATVADTGIGIAPEHLPRLTDRFYRVDDSRTRAVDSGEAGGSGLGLAICKSIAEAHGGSLAIASEAGAGTTVTVRLPACAAEGGDSSLDRFVV